MNGHKILFDWNISFHNFSLFFTFVFPFDIQHKKNVEKSIDKNIEYYNTENIKNCKRFLENPQHFFTEELCDTVLQSYNLAPKENNSRSSSANKNKSK